MARSTVWRLGLLAAVVFMVAGAVNAGAATNQPDLSSPAAITGYLRSIGVDPAAVTWQQGLDNYAGPNCPGAGWTCTTATNVVQIAAAGGQNVMECGGTTCMVVQSAPANGSDHMKCEMHSSDPDALEECFVTQSSSHNFATVLMDANATGADTTGAQNANQHAYVHQDGSDNHSDVHQSISQSLTFGSTQTQDAYQAAVVEQSASASANFSHVHQTEDQQAAGGTTQSQNTNPPKDFMGCSSTNSEQKPAAPNQCVNVTQDNSGGINGSQIDQAVGERQTTDAAVATQTQGTLPGGQKGVNHQDNPNGVGHNMNVAHQALAQRQSAPTGTSQTQLTDPGCCGSGTQVGGDANDEDINQQTTQSATNPQAEQLSSLSGIVRQTAVDGDAAPAAPGTAGNDHCDIDQHGRNNAGAGHFSLSGTGLECAFLILETTCQSGPAEAAVNRQPTSTACFPTESTGVAGVALPALTSLPTTATAGEDIGMPDYGTPTDYLAALGG